MSRTLWVAVLLAALLGAALEVWNPGAVGTYLVGIIVALVAIVVLRSFGASLGELLSRLRGQPAQPVGPTSPPATPTATAPSDLAQKTPKQIAEYFNIQNDIKLDDDFGTSLGRIVVALVLIGLVSFLLFYLGTKFTSFVTDSGTAQTLIGFAVVVFGLSVTIPWVVVVVPEITGLITVDFFRGVLRSYGTGLKFIYPWEQAKRENYINLRLLPLSNKFTFVSKDGVKVTYTYTIQYRGRMRLLGIFIRVDKDEIDDALNAIVRNVISNGVLSKIADELRTGDAVTKLQEDLENALGQRQDGHVIEYRYGIDIEVVSLSEPTFDEDYTEATTTAAIADKVTKAGKRLKDDLEVTGQSALDATMMLNKENVKKDIMGFEAADLGRFVKEGLVEGARAIADAITRR